MYVLNKNEHKINKYITDITHKYLYRQEIKVAQF